MEEGVGDSPLRLLPRESSLSAQKWPSSAPARTSRSLSACGRKPRANDPFVTVCSLRAFSTTSCPSAFRRDKDFSLRSGTSGRCVSACSLFGWGAISPDVIDGTENVAVRGQFEQWIGHTLIGATAVGMPGRAHTHRLASARGTPRLAQPDGGGRLLLTLRRVTNWLHTVDNSDQQASPGRRLRERPAHAKQRGLTRRHRHRVGVPRGRGSACGLCCRRPQHRVGRTGSTPGSVWPNASGPVWAEPRVVLIPRPVTYGRPGPLGPRTPHKEVTDSDSVPEDAGAGARCRWGRCRLALHSPAPSSLV